MIAKIAIFLGIVASALASHHAHGGHSNTFRKQDDHGNYAFGYDIVDPIGAKNFRKESGDSYGNKAGSYGIADVDGRIRIVEYVADAHGFRAKIKTNEPGTANKDSAAAVYNGPDHAGYSHSDVPAGSVHPQFNHGAYSHGHPVVHHAPVHGHGHYAHAPAHAPAHGHGYGHGYGHHAGFVGAFSHARPYYAAAPYFGY